MSTTVSIIIVLALYLVLAVPVLMSVSHRWLRTGVTALFVALATGVAAYHIEISAPPAPRLVPPPSTQPGGAAEKSRCTEALRLTKQGGIILDSASAERLVVNGALWKQVPKNIQDALVDCYSSVTPSPSGNKPEIVLRAR